MTSLLRDRSLLFAFFLSGFAALGYEQLWTRLLALIFGSESIGVLGVLAGFFGGMVLGAWLLNKHAARTLRPAKYFALLEIIIAVYAAASPYLLYQLAAVIPPRIGSAAGDNTSFTALLISLLLAFIVLLPATFCMGGTLAYLSSSWKKSNSRESVSKGIGRLYAANTLGAALGIISSVYFILPAWGFATGAMLLSAAGVLSALIAVLYKENISGPVQQHETGNISKKEKKQPPISSRTIFILLFFTGLAGIGLEVAAVHILTQLFENTIYTFSNLLVVYLAGTSAGAWLYQWKIRKYLAGNFYRLTSHLLTLLCFASALSVAAIKISPNIYGAIISPESVYGVHLFSEAALAFIVFFIPTLIMGALFSHLTGNISSDKTGKAYSLNTLGSALAPFIFGLFAIKFFGYNVSMQLVTLSYLMLLVWFIFSSGQKMNYLAFGAVAVLISLAAGSGGLTLLPIPQGWILKEKKETLMGVLMVTEQQGERGMWGQPIRRLQVDRHFRMGGGVGFAELRMGHVPLLLKPGAKSALFLGIGTGATLGAVKQYPLEIIDAVEIIPEMISMVRWFDGINFGVLNDPRITWHASDARRFAAASKSKYDLIVADLYHPGRDGAGSLYAYEHFSALRDHLSDHGIAAQWIPLYQFDTLNLKTVMRTFRQVFNKTDAYMGLYNANSPLLLLVGYKNERQKADYAFIDAETEKQDASARIVVNHTEDFFASYLGNENMIASYTGPGQINTDLNPYVLFHAPRSAYEDVPSLPYASFESLLRYRMKPDTSLIRFTSGDSLQFHVENTAMTNIIAAWNAAGHYVDGEIELAKSNGTLTETAVNRYISSYTSDTSFAPARGKLIQIASYDPKWKTAILRVLNEKDKLRVK